MFVLRCNDYRLHINKQIKYSCKRFVTAMTSPLESVFRLRLINVRNVDDWICFYLQMKKMREVTYYGQLKRDQIFKKQLSGN